MYIHSLDDKLPSQSLKFTYWGDLFLKNSKDYWSRFPKLLATKVFDCEMNLESLVRRVKDILRMREFQNLAQDASALCLMTQMHITGVRKLNLWTLLIIICCFLYVVSFIDFLPDFIPVVGWLDDIWCIRQACVMIRKEIDEFSAWLPNHPEEVARCTDKWNQMTKLWWHLHFNSS